MRKLASNSLIFWRISPYSQGMTLFGRVACCSVARRLCASDSFLGCMSLVAPPRCSVAFASDMTTIQSRVSGLPTRWRCWNTAVASRHAGCFATSMWQTTSRFTCTGLIDCYAEKSPGQTNDRGEGAQGGCFLGRKKDLFKRFFPAATRRGAGIFCSAIFEEIRVLYTIEHLVHPRQRIAVDMMDRI